MAASKWYPCVNSAKVSRLWACGTCLRSTGGGGGGVGDMGQGRVRNEDICEFLGRVAVMGVMDEKEENWKEKLKGMKYE